jgi:hypothetical protein
VLTEFRERQLSLREAIDAFQTIPVQWQLASLHPQMVAIDASRDALFHPVYWCFEAGDRRLLHSFQLIDNPGLTIRDIQSAYGYGGPISNSDDREFLRAADLAFAQWARGNDVIAEFLRFHPLVPHGKWYAGEIVDNRETVHIDLAGELFEQYQARRRSDVRRVLKGDLRVERVSPHTMTAVFPELYKKNMDQIGATQDYYFSDSYFQSLFSSQGTENWLAFSGMQAVAGAVMLVSNSAGVAEYFLGAKAPNSDEQRAMIGLLHFAADHYKSASFRYLYLGGGRSVDPDDSLLFFKKGFTSLTGRYQIGSRVYDTEIYARLKDRFPERAATGRVLFYKGCRT